MPVRAVIFDFDGTIAETIPICIEAYQLAVESQIGRRPSKAEVVASFGPNEEGMLSRDVGESAVGSAMQVFLHEYERLHAESETVIFAGATELFARLRSRDLHLGIVTGKGARSLDISLRLLGLAETFDALECGSPSGGVKVAGLRRLLDRWNLAPNDAVYVGDMAQDVRDARTVGVRSAAATWASNADPDALLAENPDCASHSFHELSNWLFDQIA